MEAPELGELKDSDREVMLAVQSEYLGLIQLDKIYNVSLN